MNFYLEALLAAMWRLVTWPFRALAALFNRQEKK